MTGPHDPGPGPGGGGQPSHHAAANATELSSMTPTLGGDSADSLPRRLRSFGEILHEDQHHRNILEVKLTKTNMNNESGEAVKVKSLNEDDISEFIFGTIH